MAIRKIHEPKSDTYPASKLYLEDIEELTEILKPRDVGSSIRYRIGDREFDTVNDLQHFGGRTANLEIHVDRPDFPLRSGIQISRWGTSVHLYSPDEDYRSKYSQIRELFDANAVWWKNAIRMVPGWVGIILVAAFYISPFGAQKVHLLSWEPALILAGLICVYFVFFEHTVVILRYSHEGGVRKWARTHGTEIIFLLAGALLGAFFTRLFEHFWK